MTEESVLHIEVLIPTGVSGKLIKWLVGCGDSVSKNQRIACLAHPSHSNIHNFLLAPNDGRIIDIIAPINRHCNEKEVVARLSVGVEQSVTVELPTDNTDGINKDMPNTTTEQSKPPTLSNGVHPTTIPTIDDSPMEVHDLTKSSSNSSSDAPIITATVSSPSAPIDITLSQEETPQTNGAEINVVNMSATPTPKKLRHKSSKKSRDKAPKDSAQKQIFYDNLRAELNKQLKLRRDAQRSGISPLPPFNLSREQMKCVLQSPDHNPFINLLSREERIDLSAHQLHQSKKLLLVLDIDHTLVHATRDKRADHLVQHHKFADIHKIRFAQPIGKTGTDEMTEYWIKLRPYLRDFLKGMKKYFNLAIYTMGIKAYADEVLRVIDPTNEIFRKRVIPRETHNEKVKKTKTSALKKLSHMVVPLKNSMVMIIDDRPEMWETPSHVIKIPKYEFFPCDGNEIVDGNGATKVAESWPLLGDKYPWDDVSTREVTDEDWTVTNMENRDRDDVLVNIGNLLQGIHRVYYHDTSSRVLMKMDCSDIYSKMKGLVFRQCIFAFTGVISRKMDPRTHPLWKLCVAYGGKCQDHLTERVTHLITRGLTQQARIASDRHPQIKIVHWTYIYQCINSLGQVDPTPFCVSMTQKPNIVPLTQSVHSIEIWKLGDRYLRHFPHKPSKKSRSHPSTPVKSLQHSMHHSSVQPSPDRHGDVILNHDRNDSTLVPPRVMPTRQRVPPPPPPKPDTKSSDSESTVPDSMPAAIPDALAATIGPASNAPTDAPIVPTIKPRRAVRRPAKRPVPVPLPTAAPPAEITSVPKDPRKNVPSDPRRRNASTSASREKQLPPPEPEPPTPQDMPPLEHPEPEHKPDPEPEPKPEPKPPTANGDTLTTSIDDDIDEDAVWSDREEGEVSDSDVEMETGKDTSTEANHVSNQTTNKSAPIANGAEDIMITTLRNAMSTIAKTFLSSLGGDFVSFSQLSQHLQIVFPIDSLKKVGLQLLDTSVKSDVKSLQSWIDGLEYARISDTDFQIRFLSDADKQKIAHRKAAKTNAHRQRRPSTHTQMDKKSASPILTGLTMDENIKIQIVPSQLSLNDKHIKPDSNGATATATSNPTLNKRWEERRRLDLEVVRASAMISEIANTAPKLKSELERERHQTSKKQRIQAIEAARAIVASKMESRKRRFGELEQDDTHSQPSPPPKDGKKGRWVTYLPPPKRKRLSEKSSRRSHSPVHERSRVKKESSPSFRMALPIDNPPPDTPPPPPPPPPQVPLGIGVHPPPMVGVMPPPMIGMPAPPLPLQPPHYGAALPPHMIQQMQPPPMPPQHMPPQQMAPPQRMGHPSQPSSDKPSHIIINRMPVSSHSGWQTSELHQSFDGRAEMQQQQPPPQQQQPQQQRPPPPISQIPPMATRPSTSQTTYASHHSSNNSSRRQSMDNNNNNNTHHSSEDMIMTKKGWLKPSTIDCKFWMRDSCRNPNCKFRHKPSLEGIDRRKEGGRGSGYHSRRSDDDDRRHRRSSDRSRRRKRSSYESSDDADFDYGFSK